MKVDDESASHLILTFAHDLRALLRSIVMSTQRIQRRPEELSPEVRAKLDDVLAAARRQEELIAAVVEYDQAMSPGLTGDTPLSLRLAIQTSCLKVDEYRKTRHGSITFNPEAIPKVLVPSGISRVLEKILHNSLKFQPPEAEPVVNLEASCDASGRVIIVVRDNGIGIEREYWEAALEPFKKLNAASEYPGTGLGLSICRRLLESIGGTIHIDDRGVAVHFPQWVN